MSETAAKNYLGAIKDSLNSPNMVLDLRMPQNQRYQQVVLDTAVAALLAGETNAGRDDAGRSPTAGTRSPTGTGTRRQLAAYNASLARQPITPDGWIPADRT